MERRRIWDPVIDVKADVVNPSKKQPRAGWEVCFKEMNQREEDALLIPDYLDSDFKDWEWRSENRRNSE